MSKEGVVSIIIRVSLYHLAQCKSRFFGTIVQITQANWPDLTIGETGTDWG